MPSLKARQATTYASTKCHGAYGVLVRHATRERAQEITYLIKQALKTVGNYRSSDIIFSAFPLKYHTG